MAQFYNGIAEIFEIDVNKVSPELCLEEYNWDSLAIISTIALIDDCFNVILEGEALSACKILADIEKLIESAKQG